MKKMNKVKGSSKFGDIFQDKLLVILIVILIVMGIIIIVMSLVNRNNLDINSDKVKELHNYFTTKDLGNCDGLFTYGEKEITYADVDSENRLCLAYQKSDLKVEEELSIDAKKKTNLCTYEEGLVFRADEETNKCTVSKIKKEIIDNTYKKLYGKDVENNEKFKVDNFTICYLKGDYYYCGLSETFTYTLGNEAVIYRIVNKAEEKGSEVVIYDYFAKINDKTCFKTYTTTTVNENCTDELKDIKEVNYKFLEKFGTKYKHVFKKADDGTYYWVSSTPVK